MKSFSVFVATALILATSSSLWHVAAQSHIIPMNHSQLPADKTAPMPDPLVEWQYPGAKNVGSSSGGPLLGSFSKTTDPIETVYQFYQKKCEWPHPAYMPREAFQAPIWNPKRQVTMLMSQTRNTQGATYNPTQRKDADSALMIIHQPKQTITVQISRDPQDKSTTDIGLVADEH